MSGSGAAWDPRGGEGEEVGVGGWREGAAAAAAAAASPAALKAQLAGSEPRLLLPGPAESQASVRWPESGANLPSRQPRVVKAGLNKG